MRIVMQGNEIALVSENGEERVALALMFAAGHTEGMEDEETPEEVAPRKRRTSFMSCEQCPGRRFKGMKGLRKHQTSKHAGLRKLEVTEG